MLLRSGGGERLIIISFGSDITSWLSRLFQGHTLLHCKPVAGSFDLPSFTLTILSKPFRILVHTMVGMSLNILLKRLYAPSSGKAMAILVFVVEVSLAMARSSRGIADCNLLSRTTTYQMVRQSARCYCNQCTRIVLKLYHNLSSGTETCQIVRRLVKWD